MKKMWSEPVLKAFAKDCLRQAENPGTPIANYENIFKENPEISYGQFEEDWEFSPPA